MRLAINLVLSLGMLALCTWLVWPDAAERIQLHAVIGSMRWADFAPYLAAYLALQAVVHLCRCVRWNHLLAPLGVRVPLGPLFAISSVGFMAILAFPARLGELVRPGLLRKSGYTTTAAALGTVAVERIVDGLVISLLVFGAFFAHQGPSSPSWMMPTAYLALGVFTMALVFLVFAMWRPHQTVRIGLSLTLLPRFAPRLAAMIEHRLLDMIRGFAAIKDLRSLAGFMAWTLTYWAINGFAMWLLAHAFHIELSLVGAYATMGLLGVGISLPNSPGLVGQFQAFTLLGLSLYLDLGNGAAHTPLYAVALTYAIAQHLLQVAWYVTMGAIGLATPWVSFHDLWSARKVASEDTDDAETAEGTSGDVKKLAPGPRAPDDRAHAHDPS